MPGQPLSAENYSAREELLSSDLMRQQLLASREVQDMAGSSARSDDARDGSDPQNGQGAPISGADVLPKLTAIAASFNMTLAFGQAFQYDSGVSGVAAGADDSPYKVHRWPSQTVVFATPDGTNPRIDLVVAVVGPEAVDVQSRNVLTDPVLRTVAPAQVAKTNNPKSTISVVTGTPAASPTAPAVPAGALALFEVMVPAAAANSGAFRVCRRLWRRPAYYTSSAHGILYGAVPTWAGATGAAAAEAAAVGIAFLGINRVVIDGEVISWSAGVDAVLSPSTILPLIVQDTGANPFGSAAPATNDKPYYLYACGGRNLPQGRSDGSTNPGVLQPICVVESTVAPTKDGRPSSAITTPRGSTQAGALYIGIGFVVKNTTFRKSCRISGDWVFAGSGQETISGALAMAGFNEDNPRTLHATNATLQNLASSPAPSDRAIVRVFGSYTGDVDLYVGHEKSGTAVYPRVALALRTGLQQTLSDEAEMDAQAVYAGPSANLGTGNARIFAVAFNMRVPRL